MDIAQVVELSGLAPSALRHYEDKGLITPSGRHGLRRQYDQSVLDRLAVIALGRDAGFSLAEILTMLPADGNPVIDRSLLLDKAEELERTIAALSVVRDNLRHAAVCKAANHLECPAFRRMLDAATARRRGGHTGTGSPPTTCSD